MFNSNTYCVKMQDFNQKGSVLVNDKLPENKIRYLITQQKVQKEC